MHPVMTRGSGATRINFMLLPDDRCVQQRRTPLEHSALVR